MAEPVTRWKSTIDVVPTGSARGAKEIAVLHAEEVCDEVEQALVSEIVRVLRGKEKRRVCVRVTSEPIPVFFPVARAE